MKILFTGFLSLLLFALSSGMTVANQDPSVAMRQKICLNGVWQFQAAATSETEIPKNGWTTLRVPSSWISNGAENFTISKADAASEHAWFQRQFFIPENWHDGRLIKLRFMAVDWAHRIYVNGKLADHAKWMRLCFDVDITSLVRFGKENRLTVWVQKQGAKDREAGIIRSVYITTVPRVHVRYAHALPSVRNMALTVKVCVQNEDTIKRSVLVNVVVKDNGRTVLTLPSKTVEIAPGKTAIVETRSPWRNPVLWGFGNYGKPYLYHLETTLKGESLSDKTYDRFGFREFRIDGSRFLFNEKPFFIKGDLISRSWPFVEHPCFVAAFYYGLRSANINFQRMHSCHVNNFDSHYWYQVGDELGHLVEAQLMITREQPDNPEHLALWNAYVNANFNHPSLIMWCLDNEHFSVPLPIENCTRSITKKSVLPWNILATYVRKLDPTRIIEFHHGFALFAGVRMGFFDRENYMTFNIHPYGNLGQQIERAERALSFDNSVPILVGEIYEFPSSIDMIADPLGSFVEQRRRGRVFGNGILDVAKHGAAGVILCSFQRTGFIGAVDPRNLMVGPWSNHVLIRDDSMQGKPVIGERIFRVKVRWPSLSGEGTKAEFILPQYNAVGTDGGYGHNFNWFDPVHPIYFENIVNKNVREAYRKVDGKNEPPLGTERAAEVVVCFGINGKPIEGAYAYLVPEDGQAPPLSAVATDADGTAWFHFWDTGRYRAAVWYKGKTYSKPFVIATRPKLTGKAGYNHIVWIDMNGIDVERRRRELAKPAEFEEHYSRMVGELLTNGDMEYWTGENTVALWNGTSVFRESDTKKSGRFSAKLVGNLTQLTRTIKMTPGKTYRISGWIYKGAGANQGNLGIRTPDYKWLVTLKGSNMPGRWQYVETDYVATGQEHYFYCLNYYMGKDGICYYDDISVKELAGEHGAFQPGPFKPSQDGFIRDWLVCGPFPNLVVETREGEVYTGYRDDLLAKYGGEANVKPRFGQRYTVEFPPADFWVEGKDSVFWRDMHSGNRVDMKYVILPSRGISMIPPVFVCAYLACIVESSSNRSVQLGIGSDDGYKVWLNGSLIGAVEKVRGSEPDQEVYPVKLKKGSNWLILKVFQRSGGWNLFVRFLDAARNPLTDITVKLRE